MKKTEILLYSDGSDIAGKAFALGLQIAKAMADVVDILDVARSLEQQEVSRRQIKQVTDELSKSGIFANIYRRPGFIGQRLIEQARATDYDLVVIGSVGRRGIKRLLAGSRACTVLGGAATSVLVVKGPGQGKIKTILTCSSAGPASASTVGFAARLAHALGASVTLLHVMSQVALQEGATGADLVAEAEELMARDAREGVHMGSMLEVLRGEGVEAQAVVRHGLVVEEIVAEARDGDFDMLIVGAHTTPDVASLLSSDLSQKIMLAAKRPILIVHQD